MGALRIAGLALAGLTLCSPAAARQRIAAVAPAADQAWFGDTPESAPAAIGDGTKIDLFYGTAMLPEAWYARDRAALTSALAAGGVTLGTLYNQWLAIADLRAAIYASGGQLVPGGLVVYPPGPSAVVHALDLALWARENALLWLLGQEPLQPYPDFADLGYRDGSPYIGTARQASTPRPADVAGVMNDLLLPSPLFAGDRVLLMPYRMPQEYGVTDVVGPGIGVWLGADADADLRHVLAHELGHAIHFRYGGYDSTLDPSGAVRPLSAFWRHYLELRSLGWQDPSAVPWRLQTPECFAEDVASLVVGAGDPLGYQTACPPPTQAQQTALLAWLRSLPVTRADPSPFQQAEWVRWLYPWPAADFGHFQAVLFTAEPEVTVSVALAAQAAGGPYTVQLRDGSTPLGTLVPGGTWTGAVPVPAGGNVEVDADSPSFILSSLEVYRHPGFVPEPRISGVFPDTLDSWVRAGVAAAVRKGIVGGYPDGFFRPDRPVTRAEFARMLATALPARLFAAPSQSAQAHWSDVPPDAWEAPFVAVVGTDLPGVVPGGPLHPDQVLTRQEAAAWAALAFGWQALPKDRADAMLLTYADGSGVSPVDAGAFAAALAAGLVQGDAGTGALRPTDPLSRADAAVLVLRCLHLRSPDPAGEHAG